MKKIFISLMVFCFCAQFVQAKEILLKIKPVKKITTAKNHFSEGDTLTFITAEDVFINSKLFIKKDTPVDGIITSIIENNYYSTPAEMSIENFKTTDINGKTIKIKGFVYKKGNEHDWVMEFLNPEIFRGGEVQIKPKKDRFNLILEENL